MSVDQLGSKQHAAIGQQYDLQKKTAAVVASHDAFTEAFAGYAVQMDDYRMTGQPVAPQVRHLITFVPHVEQIFILTWSTSDQCMVLGLLADMSTNCTVLYCTILVHR